VCAAQKFFDSVLGDAGFHGGAPTGLGQDLFGHVFGYKRVSFFYRAGQIRWSYGLKKAG